MRRWMAALVVIFLAIGVLFFVFSDDSIPEELAPTQSVEISSESPNVRLDQISDGFDRPIAIEHTNIPGDDRLYIAEQSGKVKVLQANGTVDEQVVLDISDIILLGDELGLLGLTFDPDFIDNGFLYVYFSEETTNLQQTVLARYTIPIGSTQVDRGSERRLLEIPQPQKNHNGGDITFGPDGYLYIAVGDGGGAGDPENYSQDRKSLLGKILRIDVTGESYQIPNENPLISAGGVRPEIISYGLRNPWRISLDSDNNLWIGDVGQDSVEEINMQLDSLPGSNFGWRCFEGDEKFDFSECSSDQQYLRPVASYEHTGGDCGGSVTGGFVYEGQNVTSLRGYYVFGDFCMGAIFIHNPQSKETKKLLDTNYNISTFGTNNQNDLYLADISGTIYKFEPI